METIKRKLHQLMVIGILFPLGLVAQLPASRKIDWSKAGVMGGIPTYTKVKNFLNNGGVANDPTKDNSVPLQALVNNLAGTSTIINFPKGTYRFKNKVTIPAGGKIILRGADPKETIFQFETGAINTGNFEIWGSQPSATGINVTGGAVKNSTALTLASVSGLAVGDWLDISQDNDVALMATQNPPDALTQAPRAVGQLMKITAINGKVVTVDRPLHYTYNMSLAVKVNEVKMAEGIGFEKFTIENLNPGDKSNFTLVYAANCWFQCIISKKSVSTHINPGYSANITVRDSYITDSYEFGGGGHGYGVAITAHTTDCLVENNVFDKLRHAMLVQRGANGNVFGYNYSINATSSGTISPFNRIPDGSLHGHFPYMNLYEGNVMQEIHSADTWGPSGHGNTFLRNRVTREGIRISDHSIEQNIVGNDLTKDATATFTQNQITDEAGCINTLIHGNIVGGTVTWGQGLGTNNVVQSYYLTGAPAFFNGAPWPNIGPEYTPGSGTIPAEKRFLQGAYTACESITTEVNSLINDKNVTLYPNPFTDYLKLESGDNIMEVVIYNSVGQVIERINGQHLGDDATIKTSAWPSGIYFVFVHFTEGRIAVTKAIK